MPSRTAPSYSLNHLKVILIINKIIANCEDEDNLLASKNVSYP